MNGGHHILFHRPTPWDSPIHCSTKIYAQLFSAAGYRVTYLQSLINPAHRVFRRGYYSTWRKGSRCEDGVWVTGGFSLIPYLDSRKILAKATGRSRYLACLPSIRELVLQSGYGEPALIWTTIPGSTVLKKIFPAARVIFHTVDNYAAYRGQGVTALEAEDYARADHVFVIGDVIRELLEVEFGVPAEKITNLGQGVRLESYAGEFTVPEALAGLPRPIAVWVGQGKKIDPGLLRAAVDGIKQRGGCVVLIGPGLEHFEQAFEGEDRLIVLGPRPAETVPDYLRSCDLGLMLYDTTRPEIYEYQNPLKLYEYAAAGLPTISTYHREYQTLDPPVLVVNRPEEVISAIGVLDDGAAAYRSEMIAFAHQHAWQVCMEKAEDVITALLAGREAS